MVFMVVVVQTNIMLAHLQVVLDITVTLLPTFKMVLNHLPMFQTTTDDIVGMALDVDNGKVYFHKNGTYQNQGNPNSGTNGYTLTGDAPYFLNMSTYQQSDQCEVNFGGYQ